MLWRVIVADFCSLVLIFRNVHDAIVTPRKTRHISGWKNCQLPLRFCDRLLRKILAEADQTDPAVWIVLGLSQQIACDQTWIGRVIRNNKNFSGPGE